VSMTQLCFEALAVQTGTPIGQLAYLILGGPASFRTPPRDYERGLTGGRAFLFAGVVVPLVWWGLVSLQ
jgi:hypothetical protein